VPRTGAVRAYYIYGTHARCRQSGVDMREKGFSRLHNSYIPIVRGRRYILIYRMVWDGIYLDTPTMGFFLPYGPFVYLSIDINSTEKTIFYP